MLQQSLYFDMIIYHSYSVKNEFQDETQVRKTVFYVVSIDDGEPKALARYPIIFHSYSSKQ